MVRVCSRCSAYRCSNPERKQCRLVEIQILQRMGGRTSGEALQQPDPKCQLSEIRKMSLHSADLGRVEATCLTQIVSSTQGTIESTTRAEASSNCGPGASDGVMLTDNVRVAAVLRGTVRAANQGRQ